ncbi:hypothetical protein H1R20_g4543, partial [Candolleomyces eurysporus]
MASNITALCLNVFTSTLTLLSTYYTLHPHAYPLLKNLFENDRWKKLCGYVSGAAGGGSMANDIILVTLRPGIGLCFKDRGWYPRDVSGGDSLFNEGEDDGTSSKLKQPKLHNPILLNLLKQLKPTDDPRQHELALKILSACPELVSPYLPTSGLTLDPPRLSSKWVANVSFLGSVIGGGEVPESTFYMAGGSQYRPTPPPLTTIVNNIAPGGGASQLNMRNVFTKGLQFVRTDAGAKDKAAKSEAGAGNTGNLVQHTTALVLIRCLEKMGRVREAMEGVSKALGEGADDLFVWGLDDGANADDLGPSYRKESKEGLWARRQKEVVKEVRKRVPEFQVVLAFCTAHLKTSTTTATSADVQQEESEGEQIKKALMAECAMRLLWMYQKALPEVVEEARFDVGKVLVGFDVTLGLYNGDDESGQQGEGDEGDEEEDEDVAEEEKDDKDEAKGDYNETEDQEDDGKDQSQSQPGQEVSAPIRLHRLTQLHILRFLRASPAFSFTAQSPTFPGHTHLYSLLDGIVKLGGISIHPDQDDQENGIYVELRRLVQHVLGKSLLFQWGKGVGGIAEDALEDGGGEVVAWLASLPVGLRRVRKVKRLVDVSNYNDGSDGSMDEGDESKEKNEDNIVTVHPESLDGTTLTDERLSVVAFLEDCVLRCLKTPYKYIEELERLAGDAAGEGRDVDSGASLPSPLLITLVEQLEAKLISQGGSSGSSAVLLTPSDVLAIASYLRALLFSLVGMLDVAISSATEHEVKMIVMQKILDRLDTLFAGDVWEKAFGAEPHALVRGAVVRELHIARTCLALDNWGDKDRTEVKDEDIDDFLDLIEALEIPSPIERRLTIYELIDWLRLLGSRLTQAQVVRLWEAVTELWPTGLGEVLKYLDAPSVKDRDDGISVWEALLKSDGAGVEKDSDMDVDQDSAEHVDDEDGEEKAQFDPSSLPFEYLLAQALPKNLSNSKCQEILAESALNYLTRPFDSSTAPAPLDTLDLKFITRHILHRLSAFLSIEQVDASKNLLFILASVLSQVRTLDPIALDSGKTTVVASLKGLMISTAVAEKDVRQGLLRVQEAILDPTSSGDVALVAEIASFWVDILKQHLASDRAGQMLALDAEFAGWWIRFVRPAVVLGLVRDAMQNQEGSQEVLGLCLRALKEASRHSKAHGQLTSNPQDLALLLQLHSTLSSSDAREGAEGLRREELKTVEDLIAISLESNGIPVGLGGGRELRTTRTSPSLSISIEEADKRWACGVRGASAPELDIASVAKSLLSQTLEDWSDATENIVRGFFYKGQDPAGLLEKAVIQWAVNRDGSDGNDRVIGVLHALLDCVLHRGPATSASSLDSPEVVRKIFELLLEHLINPGQLIQSDYHLSQPPCLDVLETALAKAGLKPLIVNRHLQGIVQHQHFFKLCAPSPFSSSNISLVKIRDSIISLLHNLFHLHPSNTCQVSHIEPLTKVYGGTLSSSDRRLLSIFQLFERQRKLSVRAVVGRWMPPSSSLATGSGESVGLEALQNLDGISLLRTALAFPMRMQVEVPTDFDKSTVYENQLYDPLFLLLLLQRVLFDGPPTSAISWIELFRSNVIGLALRALSARDGKLREIGMGCIVAVWTLMQNADLQERDHVLYLLGLLKNAVVPPPANSNSKDARDPGAEDGEDQARFPPRLPSYTTLLLFHALRGIFNPSTFMYPLMSRFLLQRAELDITDVPMLYNMLYSSDQDDWKKERGWMLRFLADGALTGSGVSDWRLLKRRHVWDLVASMYSSAAPASSALATNATMTDVAATGAGAGGDRAFKLSILDFLANLTRHRGPTMSLILKSGLLAWIEVQVLGPDRHASFGVEWLRILENVMVVVDVRKMDGSALKGQWVKSVARCVDGILKEAIGTPLVLVNILPLSVRLIARLSRIESIGTQSLGSLIHQALLVLKAFESNVKHRPGSGTPPLLDEIVPPPQYSSHNLHDNLLALLNHRGGLEYFDEQAAGLEGSSWSGR